MTSEILYLGGLRTSATHTLSGEKIITDAPLDNQGRGEAFSPTDLVATALGSCMLTIMGITARNHEMDIDGTKVEIIKVMAADPRRISQVKVKITMPPKEYSDKEQKMLYHAAQTCPVAQSLRPNLIQSLEIIWNGSND